MPKFFVFIDNDPPYEVKSTSRCDATLDAMDKHWTAKRIAVKTAEEVTIRMLRGVPNTQERISKGGWT